MYLVSADPFPITVDEIREAIGLAGCQMDHVIEAGIASVCLMTRGRLRRETWALPVDGDFRGRVARIGRCVEYGPRRTLTTHDRRTFRDCTFVPNRRDVAQAKAKIVRWCVRQDDICAAYARERGQQNEAA